MTTTRPRVIIIDLLLKRLKNKRNLLENKVAFIHYTYQIKKKIYVIVAVKC